MLYPPLMRWTLANQPQIMRMSRRSLPLRLLLTDSLVPGVPKDYMVVEVATEVVEGMRKRMILFYIEREETIG